MSSVLSRYLKIYPAPDKPGFYLIYSTKKGSLVQLSEAQLAAARAGELSPGDQAVLRRMEILVDDPVAERSAMESLVKRTNSKSSRFKATIVLNLDCNLACPYCYEGYYRGDKYLGPEVARQAVDFIVQEQIGRCRDVKIGFYGGEPLLSIPMIRDIARPIQQAAREKGVGFSFCLTTNATLLTRAVVEELCPLGLTEVIATLDGTRQIHDRQRPFVSGKGSFDCIVANLKEVWDLVTVQLGGNYTREEYREFPLLLDHLLEQGITPDMIGMVQFSPVTPKSGKTVGPDTPGGCLSGSAPWVIEAAPYLREETMKRGFTTYRPTMAACIVEFENDLVINYDGSLFKCPALVGWPELSIGTLGGAIGDYGVSHNLELWKNEECLGCPYLPICFGGCRLLTLLKNGAINEVDCRKGYYDTVLEQIILQDLRYGGQGGEGKPAKSGDSRG
jgi:uncharacterized protein